MNKRSAVVLSIALLCVLLLVGTATAMESTNFAINWDVFGGGGGPAASTNFAVNGTVGQWSIGTKSSTNYGVCSGYWCGTAVERGVYLPLVLRNH